MNAETHYHQLLKETTVFINGCYYPSEEAKISVFDRGFLFGDSIYEVCYSHNYSLLFFKEHLERLHTSARLLKMSIHPTDQMITEQVLSTLSHSKIADAYIRIILTRGESAISLDPNLSFKNNLITIVKSKPKYPESFYSHGVHLHLTHIVRNDRKSVDPNAKSGNYLNNVLAMEDAKKHHADDAIMMNSKGHITEGTTFNVWIVKNGIIYTPPVESGLLAGITRSKVLEICKKEKFKFEIKNFNEQDIFNASEVFITSSTRKIIPVRRLNDHYYGDTIADFPVTKKLMIALDDYIEKTNKEMKYL